jgi:hypothetical protein
MRLSSARAAVLVLLAALPAAAGCSGGPTFAEVSGTLKAGGKPLDHVQVEFWPEVSGPRSIGVTDKDGRFTLTSDDGKHPGAVVGPHKVVLVDLAPYAKIPVNLSREVENVDLRSLRFGSQYADPTRTSLRKEVAAGRTNTFDLVAGP